MIIHKTCGQEVSSKPDLDSPIENVFDLFFVELKEDTVLECENCGECKLDDCEEEIEAQVRCPNCNAWITDGSDARRHASGDC